jgi:hypothetical protein
VAKSQTDAPEVCWRTAGDKIVEVTWGDQAIEFRMLFFKKRPKLMVENRRNPPGSVFPPKVFARARKEAWKALTNPELRDEMFLRLQGKLTDAIIAEYMARVWAHPFTRKSGLNRNNAKDLVTEILKKEQPSPGVIKAVTDALVADQRERSGRGRFPPKRHASIMALRAIAEKGVREPTLPFTSAMEK